MLQLYKTLQLNTFQSKHRGACAVQLLEVLLAHADLKDDGMKELAIDVWKTVKKSEGSSKIVVSITYISRKSVVDLGWGGLGGCSRPIFH